MLFLWFFRHNTFFLSEGSNNRTEDTQNQTQRGHPFRIPRLPLLYTWQLKNFLHPSQCFWLATMNSQSVSQNIKALHISLWLKPSSHQNSVSIFSSSHKAGAEDITFISKKKDVVDCNLSFSSLRWRGYHSNWELWFQAFHLGCLWWRRLHLHLKLPTGRWYKDQYTQR